MREKGEGKPHSSGCLECFVFAERDSTLHSAVLQFSSPRLTFPLFLLLLHSSCTTSEMSNFQGWIGPSSIELEYHRNVSSPCARVVWFRNVNNLQHQNGWQSYILSLSSQTICTGSDIVIIYIDIMILTL